MKNRQRELEERWQLLNRKDKKKWTKELRPNTIIKKGLPNLIIPEKRKKKLDVIIVSVNYNDLLAVSLPINKKVFDNITVVTSKEDSLCQRICQKFRVNCVVTDSMYDDDSEFNKGKAINEGIKSVQNPDYILLLDADTIVQENIDLETLDDDVLYTSPRYICKSYKLLKSLLFENKRPQDIFTIEGDKGIGFFQLFNINNNSINRDKVYPEFSSDASWDDLIFRDKFPKRKSIDNRVIHLGDPYINWKGRKTNRFLSDEELYEILTKKSTYTICSYYFNYNDDIRQKNNFIRFLEQFNDEHLEKMIVGIPESEQIDFDIPCKLVKVNTSNKIWSKEIIINKICDKIDTDYLIWIDGDIIYDNLDWLDNIDKVVAGNDFVQLFETINYLDENGQVLETHKSIASAGTDNVDQLLSKGFKPGGSWLGRTCKLKKYPLFDKMTVGGGDTIFTYGLYKIENGWTLERIKEGSIEVYEEAKKWISNFENRNFGYLNETVNHLYHGDLKERNYNDRYSKLIYSTKKNKVPFSIIITAYNTAEFIEECLDSICNQTYFIENNNYEILIGIDCCIETLEKIKKIKNKYKNIKVLYFSENMGTYVTSNTLIGIAKHENLIRFDSDDIMNENFIESISEYEKEYKMIRFNCRNFNQKNYDGRVNLSYGCIFFKKELFNAVGGYKNWICSADKDFVQRCQSIEKVKNIDLVLFKRRIHPNSLTRHEDTNSESEIRKMYNKMISDRFEYVTPTTNPKFEIIKSKKIVFIYDVDGWAFHKMSVSLKKHLLQYEIDIKRYDEFIDSKDYDLIICFSPNVLPKYARDYSKIVCGISSYKSDINTKLSKFKFVFTNDEYLFNILNNENKFYLPNGIECSEYQKIEKQIDFNNIKIGTIGSIQRKEHKGYFRIKKIAEKLRSEGYPIEENSLFVDPYSDDVLNHEKLLKYYHENIDILIISSESETGPNILLEAMSLGIPVVANKTGLCGKLIIDGKNGFLVDEFYDLEGYVEKIKILCDKKEIFRKISMSCSESIKNYDWSVMYKNYDNMIKFILENDN